MVIPLLPSQWSHADAPNQIAKDVLQVLDALKVKKVYIFGNSLGGPIAVRMHMLKPERVAALILCAKHPPVEVSAPTTPERHLLTILDRREKIWSNTDFSGTTGCSVPPSSSVC